MRLQFIIWYYSYSLLYDIAVSYFWTYDVMKLFCYDVINYDATIILSLSSINTLYTFGIYLCKHSMGIYILDAYMVYAFKITYYTYYTNILCYSDVVSILCIYFRIHILFTGDFLLLNYARNLLPKVEWATCEHFTDGFSVGKIYIYGGNIYRNIYRKVGTFFGASGRVRTMKYNECSPRISECGAASCRSSKRAMQVIEFRTHCTAGKSERFLHEQKSLTLWLWLT